MFRNEIISTLLGKKFQTLQFIHFLCNFLEHKLESEFIFSFLNKFCYYRISFLSVVQQTTISSFFVPVKNCLTHVGGGFSASGETKFHIFAVKKEGHRSAASVGEFRNAPVKKRPLLILAVVFQPR